MRLGVPFGDRECDKPCPWFDIEGSWWPLLAGLPSGLLDDLPWLSSPDFLTGLLLSVLNLALLETSSGLMLGLLLQVLFGLLLELGIALL
jgi:hypothetical protein